MSEDNALFESIRHTPEDDAPRLVYADWLDEHGQSARAEFIRLQCASAAMDRLDPACSPLEQREQQLLKMHGAEWARPIASIARDYEFRRGFVYAVAVGARKFLTHGDQLFNLAPIRSLKLVRLGSSQVAAEDLAASKNLTRVRGLTLQGFLDDGELRTLIAAPGLRDLQALTLEGNMFGDGLEPILAGKLPRLEALNCQSDFTILNDSNLKKLMNARWALNLKQLNLQHHNLKVSGAAALAVSKSLRSLTNLGLWHCAIGLGGVQAIAQSDNFSNLAALDLRSNRLTDAAVQAIVSSTRLPALTELYLGMNKIGPEGARMLAAWPGLARLRVLHLYDTKIDDDGVVALAASPHIANLWRLDITGCALREQTHRAIEESPYLKNTIVGSFKPD